MKEILPGDVPCYIRINTESVHRKRPSKEVKSLFIKRLASKLQVYFGSSDTAPLSNTIETIYLP